MIGVYDYTVILTYISLLSASLGIVISLSGMGHPFMGIMFLLLCGLCDTFDGRVARSKKNRTDKEKKYGIQIDSLTDIVAFGVLPACIGAAFIWNSPGLSRALDPTADMRFRLFIKSLIFGILVIYILAAMIRLAYFNVEAEEKQDNKDTSKTVYTGLPVTTSALIFPLVALIQYITPMDITAVYIGTSLVTAFLFVSRIKIKKPENKGILILIAIGAMEALALIIFKFFIKL